MAETPVQHVGIKETKEALVGMNEVSLFLLSRFKDGVGFDDFFAFWEAFKHDPDLKAKMQSAYEGYNKIPAEVKDVDFSESAELIGVQTSYVPKFLAEMKKG